jgi:hypothetical protein
MTLALAHPLLIAGSLWLTATESRNTVPPSSPLHLVDVTASYDGSKGHVLRLSLTNRDSSPLTLNEIMLPWGSMYATALTALEVADPIAPGTVLERTRVLDDPLGVTITINAGERRDGKIDLAEQFPTLSQSLRRNDVVVFWSYVGRVVNGKPMSRSGGFVVVPARREVPSVRR